VSVGRSIVAVDAERCLLLTIRSSQPARLCKRVNEAGAGPGAIITGTSPLAERRVAAAACRIAAVPMHLGRAELEWRRAAYVRIWAIAQGGQLHP
jgi:hypothetical protein